MILRKRVCAEDLDTYLFDVGSVLRMLKDGMREEEGTVYVTLDGIEWGRIVHRLDEVHGFLESLGKPEAVEVRVDA